LNFSGTGAAGADHHLRLISFDARETNSTVSGGLSIGNIFQIYPLAFPGFNEPTQIFQEPAPMGLRRMAANGTYSAAPTRSAPDRYFLAREDADDLFSATGLIRPRDHVKSLIPIHGDCRLLAGRRIAMLVRDNASGANADVTDYPVFVPHPNYF